MMVRLLYLLSASRKMLLFYLSYVSGIFSNFSKLRSSFSLSSLLFLMNMTPCYSVLKTMSPFAITIIWSWSSLDMFWTFLRINSASSCSFEAAYREESAYCEDAGWSREAIYSSLKCWMRLVASCWRSASLLDGSCLILISRGSLIRIYVVVVSESTYLKHMISS